MINTDPLKQALPQTTQPTPINTMAAGNEKQEAYVNQVIDQAKDQTLKDTQKQYEQYMQPARLQLPDQMGMQVVGDALRNKIQSQYQGQLSAAQESLKRKSILDHQKKQGMVLDLANAKLRTQMAKQLADTQKYAEQEAKRKAVLGSILGLAGGVVGGVFGGPGGAQLGAGAGQLTASQL